LLALSWFHDEQNLSGNEFCGGTILAGMQSIRRESQQRGTQFAIGGQSGRSRKGIGPAWNTSPLWRTPAVWRGRTSSAQALRESPF